MRIENLTIEEILERINIQANLLDLQSDNKQEVNNALSTLANIAKHTNRRDALYALCGYYLLEIKDIDDIEEFFYAIRVTNSIELVKLILRDISKYKNIFRRRIFVNKFMQSMSAVVLDANTKDKREITSIIANSAWGEKLKNKYYCQLKTKIF